MGRDTRSLHYSLDKVSRLRHKRSKGSSVRLKGLDKWNAGLPGLLHRLIFCAQSRQPGLI